VRFHPDDDILRLFGPYNSQRHKALQGTCRGPKEGREGVAISKRGWRKEIE
jgi:hypothetical protein